MIMVVPFSGGIEIDVPEEAVASYKQRGFKEKAPKVQPKEPEPRKVRKKAE